MVAWMRHKMQELKIPSASCQPALQWASNFEGPGFVQISEDEFKARLPEVFILSLNFDFMIECDVKCISYKYYVTISNSRIVH